MKQWNVAIAGRGKDDFLNGLFWLRCGAGAGRMGLRYVRGTYLFDDFTGREKHMSDNELLQAIYTALSSSGPVVQAITAQPDAWSDGLSFLSGLMCGLAFVIAATREW